MTMLVQIQLGGLSFGLVVEDGMIVKAAPVALWTLSHSWKVIENHYRRRGAKITIVAETLDLPAQV